MKLASSTLLRTLVAVPVLVIASLSTFSLWEPRVFFGDDLAAIIGFHDGTFVSTWSQMLLEPSADKYRPVFQTFLGLMFRVFGNDYHGYVMVGYALHALAGLFVYRIGVLLTGGRFLIPIVTAAVLCSLRFGYFNITLTGPVESLSLLFLLVALEASLRLFMEPAGTRSRAGLFAGLVVLFTALAIFTHERYLAATPWAMAVIGFAPAVRARGTGHAIMMALTGAVPAVLNLAAKQFLLQTPIAVGTGGRALAFDWDAVRELLAQASYSLIGVNRGPAYLTGYEVVSGEPAYWAAVIFAGASALIVLLLPVFTRIRSAPPRVSVIWVLLLVALAGMILLPPVLTIRLEQRWLLAPAALMLIGLVWATARLALRQRIVAAGLWLVAVAGLATADDTVSSYFGDNMYLLRSSRLVAALVGMRDQVPPSGPVDLAAGDCEWTFQNGGVFTIYGDGPRDIHCYRDREAWLADPAAGSRLLVYDYSRAEFRVVDR
jgi:hypothetical protein